MNCIDCRYSLLKDGHYNCTYEEGECIKINVLEKENAELTCKMKRNIYCYSCANATERCFRNEIGCPCEKYKSYKDENAELERKLEQTEKDLADYQFNYPTIKELQKENAELKDDNKVMADNYSKMEQKFYDNLTKAKEIIRELLNSCFGYNSKTVNYEVKVKAEQFLDEVSE